MSSKNKVCTVADVKVREYYQQTKYSCERDFCLFTRVKSADYEMGSATRKIKLAKIRKSYSSSLLQNF